MDLAKQLTLTTLESALPLALVFLGIYIVFRLLNDFDLTVEGTFTLGAAVTAALILKGYSPEVSMLVAVFAGCLGGLVTALIHTRLRISLLLSGIITMTALFTVNLRVQGKPNLSLLNERTIFSSFDGLAFDARITAIILVTFGFVAVAMIALIYFLNTEYGLALRATGMNQEMARSVGVNTNLVMFVALIVSNALAALGGSIAAQDQGFSDAQMGLGIIVAGVASILLGGLVVPRSNRVVAGVVSVLVGVVLYRFVLVYALYLGLQPFDLKGFTAIILIAAIALSRSRGPASRLARTLGLEQILHKYAGRRQPGGSLMPPQQADPLADGRPARADESAPVEPDSDPSEPAVAPTTRRSA
jgi:putative tryptophan/tyrosine transport system permease protein